MVTHWKNPLISVASGMLLVSLACGLSTTPITPTVNSQGTASAQAEQNQQELKRQQLEETDVALQALATSLSATQTQAALPTLTPTVTPGPLVIQDDFNTDTGRWTDCAVCSIRGGAFYLGPYPSTDSFEGYYALCKDCGVVRDYHMEVDTWYIEGPSDRGFGLILYEKDGSYIDLEITTWQVYGPWFYDARLGIGLDAWTDVADYDGYYLRTGALKPGRGVNHIEADAKGNGDFVSYTIHINGYLARVFEVSAGYGHVGLMVGMHSIGVAFDNFYFEGMPIPSPEGPGGR